MWSFWNWTRGVQYIRCCLKSRLASYFIIGLPLSSFKKITYFLKVIVWRLIVDIYSLVGWLIDWHNLNFGHASGKEPTCQCRKHKRSRFSPLVGKISTGGQHGNPLQYSCLGNLMDRGAWQATVHEVVQELDTAERQTTILVSWSWWEDESRRCICLVQLIVSASKY